MASIGDLVVNLRADIASFRSDFQEASAHVKQFHGDIGELKSELTDLNDVLQGYTDRFRNVISLFGVGLGIRELTDSTKQSLEFAASIYDQAKALGVTTSQLQQYQYAAKQAGVSQQELAIGMESLSRNVGIATTPNASGQISGRARGAQVLQSLGVPLEDANNQLRPMGDILQDVLGKLGAMQDKTRALADAVLIFGQQAGGQLLALARDDFPELMRQAEATGNVLDSSTVAAGERLSNQLQTLSGAIRVDLERALIQLGPTLLAVASGMHQFLSENDIAGWARSAGNGIINLMEDLGEMVKFVAEHHDIFGIALGAAGGVAAIEAPSVSGRLAGFAAFAAGWKMTGAASDEAAAKTVADVNAMIASVEKLRNAAVAPPTPLKTPEMPGLTGIGVPTAGGAQESAAQRVIESLQAQVAEQKLLTAAIEADNPAAQEQAKIQADIVAALERAKGANEAERQTIIAQVTALDQSKQAAQDWQNAQKEATKDAAQDWQDYKTHLQSVLNQIQQIYEATRSKQQVYRDQMDQLNTLNATGKMSPEIFNQAAEAYRNQLAGITSESQALQNTLMQVGQTLSSGFIDAIAQGKDLRTVFQGLLQDLIKIALEDMVLIPLENALKVAMAGAGGPGGLLGSAMGWLGSLFAAGGVFDHGAAIRYARGGLVNSPTLFPMAGGRGLMGEPGPEAVVPLARTAAGDLVIKSVGPGSAARGGDVHVEVHNYSSAPARTESRVGPDGRRHLQIMIGEAIARDFHEGGPAAVALKSSFGVPRNPIDRG